MLKLRCEVDSNQAHHLGGKLPSLPTFSISVINRTKCLTPKFEDLKSIRHLVLLVPLSFLCYFAN